MNLSDYDYNLPPGLIAQEPAENRDKSRLMVLDRASGSIRHDFFARITSYLSPKDIVVLNDTKVFPARLIGRKADTGGEAEIFLLKSDDGIVWEALCRPSRRLKRGSVVVFGDGRMTAEIIEKRNQGHVTVRLDSAGNISDAIDALGETPLPPYIRRRATATDRERYQTVYADNRGSVAAPTAGLHFSTAILESLSLQGIIIAKVTLHVGIGTFRPLTDNEIGNDYLHSEYCIIPETTAESIKMCRKAGGRVFAVGTTTTRALETASKHGEIKQYEGWTDIFIKPPYRFKSVDCLITNFHLPRSSLLMMVSAFAGRETVLRAYGEAVREHYRFYSYGDAMLIL